MTLYPREYNSSYQHNLYRWFEKNLGDPTCAEVQFTARHLCHCCSESSMTRNIAEHKRTIEPRVQIPARLLTEAAAFHMLMLPAEMNRIRYLRVVSYWLEAGLTIQIIISAGKTTDLRGENIQLILDEPSSVPTESCHGSV
jgi:hypothetical protein